VFLKLPDELAAMVCSRSGLALKKGVYVLNSPGIIDTDYRGEIGAILHNVGVNAAMIQRGDRIAQLVFFPRFIVRGVEIPLSALEDSSRGAGGFGSTGE